MGGAQAQEPVGMFLIYPLPPLNPRRCGNLFHLGIGTLEGPCHTQAETASARGAKEALALPTQHPPPRLPGPATCNGPWADALAQDLWKLSFKMSKTSLEKEDSVRSPSALAGAWPCVRACSISVRPAGRPAHPQTTFPLVPLQPGPAAVC